MRKLNIGFIDSQMYQKKLKFRAIIIIIMQYYGELSIIP